MDVIFKSINQGDVVQAAEHGVWQHGKNALQVNAGDRVYVVPTHAAAALVHMENKDRLVLIARLKEVTPPQPEMEWVSKGEYSSDSYILEECMLVPIQEVPDAVLSVNNNTQNSLAYCE